MCYPIRNERLEVKCFCTRAGVFDPQNLYLSPLIKQRKKSFPYPSFLNLDLERYKTGQKRPKNDSSFQRKNAIAVRFIIARVHMV